MSKIDLSTLSASELRTLLEEVKAQLEKTEEEERRQAYEAIEKAAQKVGMTPKEILRRYGQGVPSSSAGASKESAAVAYRNPQNAAETWSGRGRKPRWLMELLEAGKSLEDFAV